MLCFFDDAFVCVYYPCSYLKENADSCLSCPRFLDCTSCIHFLYDDDYGDFDCKVLQPDQED